MAKAGQEARMRRLVARWQQSGESGASFARREGIAPWTFWCWQRKLSETAPTERGRRGVSVPLVPVQIVPEGIGDAIEIVLATGDRVRVGAGTSVELIQSVLTALRSA